MCARTQCFASGATIEVFDLRMYVHNLDSPALPLSKADVRSIALTETPTLSAMFRCKPITSILDTEWTDEFGHPCKWYFKKRETHPWVCKSEAAASNCPLACLSVQECCIEEVTIPSFQVWDRIRRIEPMNKSPNGTLCLGTSLSRAQVLQVRVMFAPTSEPQMRQQ